MLIAGSVLLDRAANAASASDAGDLAATGRRESRRITIVSKDTAFHKAVIAAKAVDKLKAGRLRRHTSFSGSPAAYIFGDPEQAQRLGRDSVGGSLRRYASQGSLQSNASSSAGQSTPSRVVL